MDTIIIMGTVECIRVDWLLVIHDELRFIRGIAKAGFTANEIID